MAEYRYYLIPDAMTRAFPEQFEKQTPTEFFDNIADLEKRYHQLREMPYNNERTWNERARFPYARLLQVLIVRIRTERLQSYRCEMASITCAMTTVAPTQTVVMHKSPKWLRNL